MAAREAKRKRMNTIACRLVGTHDGAPPMPAKCSDGGDTAVCPAAGGFLAFAALRKKWRRQAIGRQNFGKASSVCNVRSQLVDNAAGAEF